MAEIWVDLRQVDRDAALDIVRGEQIAKIDVVVTADLEVAEDSIGRVDVILESNDRLDGVSSHVIDIHDAQELAAFLARSDADASTPFIWVDDHASLEVACQAAQNVPQVVVNFADPTKIPLEIVIAAADSSDGKIICGVGDGVDAGVTINVLEKGPGGVIARSKSLHDIQELLDAIERSTPKLELEKFTVRSVTHSGVGERVCVDTCTQFAKDEGLLVGSFAHGLFLCVSETHPLPYMPTRPFRVNAGALHSYIFRSDGRTKYLSEVEAGDKLLACTADGRTREVVVGRAKIETRPILTIEASAVNGQKVCLAVQDDWHVRVLGPGAKVLNVTELRSGDSILGFQTGASRHVGWPVDEFCIET